MCGSKEEFLTPPSPQHSLFCAAVTPSRLSDASDLRLPAALCSQHSERRQPAENTTAGETAVGLTWGTAFAWT